MGVGKSLVAKHLAAKLNRDVVSTDEVIVAREGKPITQIFEEKGEEYFRHLEAQAVADIAARKGIIIDCGGGIAVNPQNMKNLRKNGIVFYLSAGAEEIYKNVSGQKHRPLLNAPDPKARMSELLNQRRPFYEKADHIIDANGKTGEQLCAEILLLLRGQPDA